MLLFIVKESDIIKSIFIWTCDKLLAVNENIIVSF